MSGVCVARGKCKFIPLSVLKSVFVFYAIQKRSFCYVWWYTLRQSLRLACTSLLHRLPTTPMSVIATGTVYDAVFRRRAEQQTKQHEKQELAAAIAAAEKAAYDQALLDEVRRREELCEDAYTELKKLETEAEVYKSKVRTFEQKQHATLAAHTALHRVWRVMLEDRTLAQQRAAGEPVGVPRLRNLYLRQAHLRRAAGLSRTAAARRASRRASRRRSIARRRRIAASRRRIAASRK